MLKRLWLIFAQATAVGLGLLFVVATLRPDWLQRAPRAVLPAPELRTAAPDRPLDGPRGKAVDGYADAVRLAAPAVVVAPDGPVFVVPVVVAVAGPAGDCGLWKSVQDSVRKVFPPTVTLSAF